MSPEQPQTIVYKVQPNAVWSDGVPITSTKALTNATLPYVEAIANKGLRTAVAADPALARGVNVIEGKVTYEAVAEAHGLEYTPLDGVLPLSAV